MVCAWLDEPCVWEELRSVTALSGHLRRIQCLCLGPVTLVDGVARLSLHTCCRSWL
jgi:hypothetical protein